MYVAKHTHSRRRAKEKVKPTRKKRKKRERIHNHYKKYSPSRPDWKQDKVGFCSKGTEDSRHGQLFESDSEPVVQTRARFIDILHPSSCYYHRWIFALKIRYEERKAMISKPKIEFTQWIFSDSPLLELYSIKYN